MAKHILIDSYFGLVRTAIAQGGKLLDYYEESPDQGRTKGNIYLGIVKKVDPHIQAAFVRYGGGRDGFLPLRDIPFRSEGKSGKKPKGGETPIGQGDAVLVQVVKDEVGSKGAALTTKLSLSGRYLVYMPGRSGEGGISSRLSDEDRAALKKAMGELQIPEDASLILRTAALGKPAAELQADLDRLDEAYREIREQAETRKEPGIIYREAPPALRYLREYYTSDVERIWVNREDVLEQCRQFFHLYEPKSAAKVSLSKDGPLMFQRLGLEAEVDRLTARKVTLPSGANFVIDQTEALVAIDVNSAKSKDSGRDGGRGDGDDEDEGRKSERRKEKELEDAVFAINMEAGAEIARQLRLRDLGGIIVVDFIDMEEEGHRRKLEESMRRALSADKAKVKVFDISPLGLLQISRQRLRKAGPHFSKSSCESCQGKGWLASPATLAFAALRKMEEKLQGRRIAGAFTVTAPYPVANQLMNEFRTHVLALEERHGCVIRVKAEPSPVGEPTFVAPEGESRAAPAKDKAEPPARDRKGSGRERSRPSREATREAARAVASEAPADTVAEAAADSAVEAPPQEAAPRAEGNGRERRGRKRGEGRGRGKTAQAAEAEAEDGQAQAPIQGREVGVMDEAVPEDAASRRGGVDFAPAGPGGGDEPMGEAWQDGISAEAVDAAEVGVRVEGGGEGEGRAADGQGPRRRSRRGRGRKGGRRDGAEGRPDVGGQGGRDDRERPRMEGRREGGPRGGERAPNDGGLDRRDRRREEGGRGEPHPDRREGRGPRPDRPPRQEPQGQRGREGGEVRQDGKQGRGKRRSRGRGEGPRGEGQGQEAPAPRLQAELTPVKRENKFY